MAYQGTVIMGEPAAQFAQMEAQVRRINPTAPDVAALYLRLGPRLGVRGDLAFAQALHETDYFRYGGLVQPNQNNYAGIGATGPGEPGASFPTTEIGVLAHLQHLYAYASREPLPSTMEKVDPWFDLVRRGSAPTVGDLNGKWAVPGEVDGQSIDAILGRILMEGAPGEPYTITQALLSTSSQNRPGRCDGSRCWQGVQGIVVHRTASRTMDAWAIRRYFNDAPDGRYASSQFVVDNQVILQMIPVGEVAFHTAGQNQTQLGIETCEHNWGRETWPETYRKLVWLTAYLARSFQLDISQVTGHFRWDPVNRPYDPTHIGWTPAEGQATGLFDWHQFIADVSAQLTPAPEPGTVPVRIERGGGAQHCKSGILVGSTTYVPIRAYTACLEPEAVVVWDPRLIRVTVQLPATDGQAEAVSATADGGPVTAAATAPTQESTPAVTETGHHVGQYRWAKPPQNRSVHYES